MGMKPFMVLGGFSVFDVFFLQAKKALRRRSMRKNSVGNKTSGDVVNGEEPNSTAPYHSPFGGYNYYPTTLFKRDALPAPPHTEEASLKNASPPGHGGDSGRGDGRTSSWGTPHIKLHRINTLMITPLMDRYKRRDSVHAKQSRGEGVNQDVYEGRNASAIGALSSSNSLKGSLRVDTVPGAGTVGKKGKRNISSSEVSTKPIEIRRDRTQLRSQRMTASCPPALYPDSSAPNDQKAIHIENNDKEASTPLQCCDVHCIHGRQAILDYIDLQRDLRACYATLRDQDTELNELRSQLSLLRTERVEMESRFQIQLHGMENRYAEDLAKEREEQMEWQQRVLSEQLATYERDREELEKLRTELTQERLNHDHTRGKLGAAQDMCLALKQQLEKLQDAAAASASPLRGKDLSSGKARGHGVLDAQSPTSTLMTPTPRRQPPPTPEAKEDTDGVSGAEASTFPLLRGQSPPSHSCREEWLTDRGLVGNVASNSTINVSDPSVAFSAVPDLDPEEAHSFLLRSMDHHGSAKRAVVGSNEECDGGMQRETEYMELDGRLSSCKTRNTTLSTVGVQRVDVLANDAASCGPSSSRAFSEAALMLHPPSPDMFEQLAGRESELCKELLRIILDKEKQLAELVSARLLLGEGTKLTFLPE
ncbi:hypothetical protein TraAM80_06469 [Trypanosoma rangeli]|uniref:Uncharacterized protein n=1 Tax=Trypanosoma rangeli TaxID=5698 RepID=A0A3R7MH01_TRYRA|nr:uncharacterized protein TraAM80_06469 [Trypanosoma rangeli]RNF02341.1 hypothetical protein TraAM80_06469 [Trypanosoma rangeli]|eukprot:RNF02341.1 hypothetical protein TraAM80_06469 [Trypanosoma rangeli]